VAALDARGAGLNRAERLAVFEGFPARLEAAAVAASTPAPPGEWGAIENARHLIAVEREVHQRRLADLATLDDPRWTWTEPGQEPGFEHASVADVLATFAAARATTVAIIQGLDEAGWQRHGTHATYGVLDVEGLLGLAIDHDEDHLGAIAALARR
jgi:hypothetical protein